MAIYVTKASGDRVPFEKKKIVKTCIRSGVPNEVAERIASEVESKIYDGMPTKELLERVLAKLRDYEEHHEARYDLKRAIASLSPEFHEFEKYISHLLRAHGYETRWDIIVQGECIEHQIDVIASKDGKNYLVECKHHVNPHRFCGLGTVLQVWAVIDDIRKGYKVGKTKEKYENIWLFNNTKFSEHAIRYSKAKDMILTGWSFPKKNDLQGLVSKKGMYPITMLDLNKKQRESFSNAGILLLQELVSISTGELTKKTGISREKLEALVEKANKIISG